MLESKWLFSLKLKLPQSDPPICVKAFPIFLRWHYINFSLILILFSCFHLWVLLQDDRWAFNRWVGMSAHAKYYLQGINNTFLPRHFLALFSFIANKSLLNMVHMMFYRLLSDSDPLKDSRKQGLLPFLFSLPSLHVWKWKRVCLFFSRNDFHLLSNYPVCVWHRSYQRSYYLTETLS